MSRSLANLRSISRARLGASCCLGKRATCSRAISVRADSKLAPCMVRPNLFSGD